MVKSTKAAALAAVIMAVVGAHAGETPSNGPSHPRGPGDGLASGPAATAESSGTVEGRAAVPDTLARVLDDYLSRLEPFGLAGAFLVAREGEVLLARGYGPADRGDRGDPPRRWTAGTVSSSGSITKQFTAAAIMALQERGALSVHDSLSAFFPDVPPDKRAITLHHLLTHSSGLGELPMGDFDALGRDAMVSAALSSELLSAPGERHAYSNLGYSLLGAVVERVTGTGYEAWVREHLFRAAGMYETGYLLPGFEPERLAIGYSPERRFGTVLGRIDPERGPSWVLYANGGMHTTVHDMYRWAAALLHDVVLDAASRRALFGAHVESAGGHYGYGWAVDTTARGTPFIHHSGSNGIFYADYHLFPAEDAVTYAMTSDATFRAPDVLTQLDRLLFGAPVPWPPRLGPGPDVATGTLDALTGRYRLRDGGTLVVARTGAGLVVHAEGQSAVDRLWRGEPAGRVPYDVLNRQAAELVRALASGDWATVRKALGGDPRERPYEAAWQSLVDDAGPFRSVAVLGTVPAWFHEGSADVTWVRLRFERATRIRRIHWGADGTMVGLGGEVYPAPLTLRCAVVSDDECAGFHLTLSTAGPRFRFDRPEDGPAHAVTVHVDDAGPAVAERISSSPGG